MMAFADCRARLRDAGRAVLILTAVGLVMILAAGCGGSASASGRSGASGTAGLGTVITKPIPAALRMLPLLNQAGKRLNLESWPGKTVLLVPFLTLCQDVCPLITGNLIAAEQALHSDGAANQVQIVELTVDPRRDTPHRLAAYAKLTGANWTLTTESPAVLHRLAKFFGFHFVKVPEEKPPSIDWLTGRPLTYDVDHSDNYFVIDPRGTLRVVQDAAPNFHGKLNPRIYNFLDDLGHEHLKHPPQPDWTPTDVLNALAVSVGHPLRGS